MAFAANPFSTSVAGARSDGEGLNPLLQNYWMVIHPPCLYTGFVGCTVPFAFAVAALVTGRLDHEWIVASRKWTLFAWMFLGIGNTLGMVWAYEELGWGGYWGWDPVENAAFMPFLTASAFVHSVMIQERRGLLKVWNVFLICLTFFLTIFGTFLTRSGMIASVHSFAQSSIGTYFAGFLLLLVAFATTLVMWRWPELRDIKADPKVRWAAVFAGWIVVAACLPGLAVIWRTPLSVGWRVCLIALVAGGSVYVALELVFRRMTKGLDVGTTTATHRVLRVARVHVPAQQLDPRQPAVLHSHRHDVPDDQRGAHGRQGHRRAALLQGMGPAAGAGPLAPHGRRYAFRLEEDGAGGPAQDVPRAAHRVGMRRGLAPGRR